MSYTLDLVETEDGEHAIIFPDEIVSDLGWQEGDVLEWNVKGQGIVINKLDNGSEYEIEV